MTIAGAAALVYSSDSFREFLTSKGDTTSADWRLVSELLFIYLLPLPLFLGIAYLLPAASWSRFVASMAAVLILASIFGARFHRPFRDFFMTNEAGR